MNNSLFTQTFTRLKPTKYLTNLAHLKHLKSLSALILATLLVACGGGGGGGGGGAVAPVQVSNFNVVPRENAMELSWTNPARTDITSINISWAAYNKNDISVRNTVGDGYLMINNSDAIAAAAINSHNLVVNTRTIDGTQISGAILTDSNVYVFYVQLSFAGGAKVAPQLPDIPAPNFPRAFGPNTDGNSFAASQVYSANPVQHIINGGNVTLTWTNPQVSAGNITSVLITYQSNLSTSEARGSIPLTSPEHLIVAGTSSYTWTDLAPGQYNFTIQPILGDVFFGVEVAPGMLNVVVPEPSDPSTDPMTQPPLIAITTGVPEVNNLPAIPGTAHEITVTATKQDTTDTAEVMFTTSFADASNNENCDVEITNPTASYVGDGIGSIATTNITISYGGPLSANSQCRVNVAVTEGTKTSNLPAITGRRSAIYVQFLSVNVRPLLELSGVPTGTPFPDERPRIGVQATKQDSVRGGEVSSEVMVVNGACMAILDGDDISISPNVGFEGKSSIAYYRIILNAANAVSAIAAERECELDFSVTETETQVLALTNDPIGTEKTTNRTIVLSFAQEIPPLFVNISTSSGSSVTSPSNRDVLVNLTLEKQDASNTRDLTLPDTINSVGDVCTATLRTSARYAATSIGSVANATYAVRINNFAISANTACGAFVFTATEGSATSTSTASASPAITFTPSTELPPVVVVNATASTINNTINSVTSIIAVTITKQDNEDANLAVTGVISEGLCSIRELTNTGYGANPVLGSIATASYEVNYTGNRIDDDGNCRVNIVATEDGSPTTLSQPVSFSFSNVPPSAGGIIMSIIFSTKEDYTNGVTKTVTITDGDPDDGERPTVSYTALPGGCRVANPSISSFVGATAAATFTVFIDVRGGQTLNSVLGCVVRVIPTEVVVGTDTALTLIGASHLPPLVSVPDNATGAAGVPFDFTVTATKQDPGFTTDIVFATDITASADCTVTAGAVTLGSPTSIGNTYTRVYSVARATAGDCTIPKSSFTVREDTATANGGTGNIVISFIPDFDGDGVMDAMDVDEDGDGLIEIHTADELNQTRNDLAGSSFSGNSSGCGGRRAGNALECNGYELVADIDLSAYDNWNPIGRDPAFAGIFEGNNHTIDNLNMQLYAGLNWGLFGYTDGATIRNAHVRNVNITFSGDNSGVVGSNFIAVPRNVGGLIGLAERSMIINSSVIGHLVAGARNVGGLVGGATVGGGIISSYVELEEVNATSVNVGGLVGQAQFITIRLSYALTDKATVVRENGGGLVGNAFNAHIESSMAITTNITTQNLGLGDFGISTYGGLAGIGAGNIISFTAGITGNMLGDVSRSGGLLGFSLRSFSRQSTIDASYAITQFQTVRPGNNQYGGLVGDDFTPAITRNSYWDNTTLTPSDTRNRDASQYGQGKSTTALQGTTDFSGSDNIFAAWANGWCDAATNEFTTDPSHSLATIPNADANRFWDLGAANEYPAMNCLPNFTPAEQRAAMAKALKGESPIRNLR